MPGPNWLTSWVKVNQRHVAYAPPPSSSSNSGSPRASRSSPHASRAVHRGGGTGRGREDSGTNNGPSSKAQHQQQEAAPPPSPKNHRSSLRSGSFSLSSAGGGGGGWKSSDSSASQSKRDEPLFGVSTALRADLSVARSLPAPSHSNHDASASSSRQSPPTRRRSGKKSSSYDENRARESDLASAAHHLLAGFFAPPADEDGDTSSAATYPRFVPGSSGGVGRRRVGAASDPQPAFRTTGRYLNEAAFVQQLEQRRLADGTRRPKENGSASVVSAPDLKSAPAPRPVSTPVPETSLAMRPSRHSSRLHHSTAASSLSVKSDASPSAMSAPPAFGGGLKLFPPSFFPTTAEKTCDKCQTLQAKLDAALDDVEYLRTAVLEQEMAAAAAVPAPVDSSSNKPLLAPKGGVVPGARLAPGPSVGNRPTRRLSAMDCSRQVGEATQRHRKQVEQLTKERIRWQQDIHFKLHKFANLCKDLNEESVVRNETALTLEQELMEVKDERDSIFKERNELLARVKQLEMYEAECQQMRQRLLQNESGGLLNAEEMIRARDQTISELSKKLDKTLDELEMERAQRQRRQIIFPVNGGATFNESHNL